MAALESTRFAQFTLPLSNSNPPFCNRNTLRPAKSSRLIRSPTSSQKARRPTVTPRSKCRTEADGNMATSEGRQRALAVSYDESDDDLPSLKELSRTAPQLKISTEASKLESTAQRLEQPAVNGAGLQVDRTQPGLGGRRGESRDQPLVLDDDSDEAEEGTPGDVDTRRIGRDASPHNTLATSELASGPTKSIDTSGLWYDMEKGCYIGKPALRLGSCEQQGVTSAPAQDQPQTLSQSSQPLQDQINQQRVGSITQSMPVGPTPHSLPKLPDNGDDGWTDDSTAELEKELGLALVEQVSSSSASTPSSPRPRLDETPQDVIQSREPTETTGSRLEESRDASRHNTPAQAFEEGEPREEELVGEAGGVEMQQEEIAGQKEELRRSDLVVVDGTDDPDDKEATETLPATQLEINEHHFRLRRVRKPVGRQREYQVVWGEHPNRYASWVNEDNMRMSMLRPPYERSSQDLVSLVERDVTCVHRMRCDGCSKGRKIFEYQVGNSHRTWITEDQLRISLSPTLLSKLRAASPPSSSQAQSQVHLRHPATPINEDYRHTPRNSRSPSPSAPFDPAPGGELESGKRGEKRQRRDTHTEISNETRPSVNTDDAHDTGDEDPRPAKRRKPRLASAVTAPLHVRRSRPLVSPSTTSLEIDDALPQAGHGCPSTLVNEEQCYASRISRSPSAATGAVPVAEYQEWPFQGFLKRTTIGNQTTYNLEFALPRTSEHFHLSLHSEVLGSVSGESPAKATVSHRAVSTRKPGKELTKEQESLLAKMVHEDKTWAEIGRHFPGHTLQSLKGNFFTKQGGQPRKRGRKPGARAGGA